MIRSLNAADEVAVERAGTAVRRETVDFVSTALGKVRRKLVDFDLVEVMAVADGLDAIPPAEEVIVRIEAVHGKPPGTHFFVCGKRLAREARVVHELPEGKRYDASGTGATHEGVEQRAAELLTWHMVQEAKADREVERPGSPKRVAAVEQRFEHIDGARLNATGYRFVFGELGRAVHGEA